MRLSLLSEGECVQEGWGNVVRGGVLASAIGLMGGGGDRAAGEEPPVSQSAGQSASGFSDEQIQRIINRLSDKLSESMDSKRDEIVRVAKLDRNWDADKKLALKNAAAQVCVGPIFGLKAPFKLYKLDIAAEEFVRGKDEGSHAIRQSRIDNYFGGRRMPTVRGSFRVGDLEVMVPIDGDDTERVVSGALILKFGDGLKDFTLAR